MKKIELEIVKFGVEDVIATSAAPSSDPFIPVDGTKYDDSKI